MAVFRGRIPTPKRDPNPTSDETSDEHSLTGVMTAFQTGVLGPMLQQVATEPANVRACIAELRTKLDALDVVLGTGTVPAATEHGSTGPDVHPALRASLETAHANGGGTGSLHAADVDDIGRNARSRVRELTLLEAMAKGSRAYTLQQLMAALAAGGFDDSTDAAVVSQLHRLKKNDVIHQPANGFYEITDGGLAHLRKLRNSVGALLR